MSNAHALLSASSSQRWLNCPPSARLCENYEDKGSDYAAEGTDAHTLCEHKLKKALRLSTKDPTEDLTYYSEEMEECAEGYTAYVLELISSAKQTCADPVILIEQRVDFSRWVEGGFGTADCIIIADSELHVVDYKHGKGVLVDATENPQMRLYALGALEMFDGIYDISRVSMSIYQPRRANISTHTVFKESIYDWADTTLRMTAKLAAAGEGDFSSGEWCGFCPAKARCRARADANMELAAKEFSRPPALLDDQEVAYILPQLDAHVSWANDLKEYALQAAIAGKTFEGYKLVEGRSDRRYISEAAVASTVTAAGYDPYERKVLGVTAMEKVLGKKTFGKLLDGLIEKPKGKPTLVPVTDKRPPINTAKNDFTEE